VLLPLDQEEREDAIYSWLNLTNATFAGSEAIAETSITFELLDAARRIDSGTGSGSSASLDRRHARRDALTAEIQEAASTVSSLVGAIKGFTEMDRISVSEPSISARDWPTPSWCCARRRRTNRWDFASMRAGPAAVNGFGGELNQVGESARKRARCSGRRGSVELAANREKRTVVVRVIDNGRAFPEEIRVASSIRFYDQAVGKGNRTGLDIERRWCTRHNGQIELDTSPGRTEFRVTIPVGPRQRWAEE
jgi:light-regulated signal transduction histidine kinase (bacteriophytochrome)